MRVLRMAVALAALAVPLWAQAPDKPFEASLFVGSLFGGRVYDITFENQPVLIASLGNHVSYGLQLGYNVDRHLELEFRWSHVHAAPAGIGLTLDYLLPRFTYNFGRGQTRPYAAVSFGAVRIAPTYSGGLAQRQRGSDLRFTSSLGVGVKHLFTPSVGVRLEATSYASQIANISLGPNCTFLISSGPGNPAFPVTEPCPTKSWLLNGELSAGLLIKF